MKFTIVRADLLRALNHVQGVVERRNTIPILANVLLRAEGDALSLATTDMDLEIVESVAAQVSAPGATTVPAHTLYDIARKLPDDAMVECSLVESTLLVKSGKSTFRLGCLPVEDFPRMGSADSFPVTFSLPAADLRTMIDRTRFAMSNEETRYYLNGIYLHAETVDGIPWLRAVATNGHFLARFQIPLPEEAVGMPGIIVPRKAVSEVRKLIEEAGAAITLSLSENKIRFAFDHVVLTSKLIDGTFPDYRRVIPQGNDKPLDLDPTLSLRAVDRVSTISSEKSRAVKLTLKERLMTLSTQAADAGSATEEIEINWSSGAFEVGFNSAYLMEVLRQMDGESCRLLLSDPSSPTIIQDTGDSSALYVLMPMRV